jgi:diguanylate cyclase (GGDEF)-like protein/PAS domain S-box-containing protein
MTLRTKTLAVTGTTLVLMILIIYSITEAILLGGYTKLEKQNILQNADQAVKMIDDEFRYIESFESDWAGWDDTYQFVQDINQEYIDNNLTDATVLNLHVDFLIYIKTDNRLAYCKFVDPETGEDAVCPDSLIKYVFSNSFLLRNENNINTLTGLAILPENPIFLAYAPILTSQFQGPVRGTLITGRYLSSKEVKRLGSKVNLPIKLQRIDSPQLPHDFNVAKQSLSIHERITAIELDENTIATYALLTDLQNKPILMMRIDKERLIFAQGKASMNYFILSLLVIGLVFILATLSFLEVTVLSRVIRLSSEVKDIGSTGDLLKKTTVSGQDEVSGLSTAINQMLESVRVSTERDRAILETMEDAYFELDLKGDVTFFNDSLARIFGYQKDDYRDLNYRHFLSNANAKITVKAFGQLFKTGKPIKNLETGFFKGNGEQIFLESTVSIIENGSGKAVGFRGIARDVTDRKRASEELRYMVYHDSLTGLLNRKAFHENLASELLYADRYSQERTLLFMDLDKFKKVNDTYGHDVGDKLLKKFTERIGNTLRKTDGIYRLGGDEFAIILPTPSNQDSEITAQKIVDMMMKPFQVEEITIDFVTISIGVSIFPLNGTHPETLLSYADKTMYEAKKSRNTYATNYT